MVRAQALQVQLRLQASFLNNSASRWEALADPWTVRLEGIDHGSPVYRSDHQRCGASPPAAAVTAVGHSDQQQFLYNHDPVLFG